MGQGSLCGLFFVYAEPAYLNYVMAFVRKKVKTFKWPVEVQEPSDTNPGQFEKSDYGNLQACKDVRA